MREIRNPGAYEAAKNARIKMNAATTRRRALEAEVANDSPEFRCWLFTLDTEENAKLYEIARALEDANDYGEAQDAAYAAYHKGVKTWRLRVGFLPSFLHDALNQWGGLSAKQLEVARRIFAENVAKSEKRETERAAKIASALPWVEGKQTVAGKVLSVKYVDGGGPAWQNRGSMKAMIETTDGRRLWTTIPSKALAEGQTYQDLKGTEISLTVTVSVSPDDPTMAFGKRPSIAKGGK